MTSRLREYVQDRLEGSIQDAQRHKVSGPRQAPYIGRNKPHRGDRKWVNDWSPEQITNRLRIDFPDDPSMGISHQAIYQALYIRGRGALKRELVSYLRTGRALRTPRARSQAKAWAHVSEEVMISNRPAEIGGASQPQTPAPKQGRTLVPFGNQSHDTQVNAKPLRAWLSLSKRSQHGGDLSVGPNPIRIRS